MGRASEFSRRVAKKTDGPLVRAVANEREFFRESIRVLFTPYAAPGRWFRLSVIRPEGLTCALGVLRTLSRMVKDAARAGAPPLRLFDACCGYLIKYSAPVSQAGAMMASTPQSSAPVDPKSQASTLKRSRSPARFQAAESRPSYRDRSPRAKGNTRQFGREPRRSRRLSRVKNPARAHALLVKDARETRAAAWRLGRDGKGASTGKCNNWYLGTGTRVPRHQGSSRRGLSNKCYVGRCAPVVTESSSAIVFAFVPIGPV